MGEALRGGARLTVDFLNFTLVLVFYGLCWTVGAGAFVVDKAFGTGWFDGFVSVCEFIDNGGRR